MRLKITLSLYFCAVLVAQAQRNQVYTDYINQYKDIAIREFQRTGVPASITLAQAVVESGAGTSELALNAKNHFGIKARNNWTGGVYYLKDDDKDAQGNVVPSPFRMYTAIEDSYKDHSDFLKANKRYDICFAVTPPTDYKTWARKLLEAGYATAPNYPDILIYVIENYELYKFDAGVQPNQPVADVNAEVRQGANGIIFINDVKAIYVSNNMSLEQISGRHDVPLVKLKEYNENMMSVRSDQPLNNGQVLFLQRKNRSFHGHTKFHIVKQGERMRDIAQKYGIRLYRLYTKNEMIEGTEPAIGERLILRRGWFEGWQTPQLRDASQESPVSPVAPPTAPTVPADVTNTTGAQPQGSGFPAAPPAPSGSTPSSPTSPTSTPVSTTTYTDGRIATTYSDGRITTTHPDGRTTTTYPDNRNSTTYPDNNNTTTYPSTTTPSTTTTTETTTPVVVKPAPVRPVKPAAQPVKPSTSTTSAPKPPTTPTKPTTAAAPVKPAAAPVKPAAAPVKPAAAPVKPAAAAPSTAAASSTASHHTVGQGETLYSISRKYGTTVDNIKKLNNLTSNGISVGLKLKVK
jgi:LysM repeat protein